MTGTLPTKICGLPHFSRLIGYPSPMGGGVLVFQSGRQSVVRVWGRRSCALLNRSLFRSRFESGARSRIPIRNGVRLTVTSIDRMRTTDEAAVSGYVSFQTVAGFNGELPRLFSRPV